MPVAFLVDIRRLATSIIKNTKKHEFRMSAGTVQQTVVDTSSQGPQHHTKSIDERLRQKEAQRHDRMSTWKKKHKELKSVLMFETKRVMGEKQFRGSGNILCVDIGFAVQMASVLERWWRTTCDDGGEPATKCG